jgi:hypothetical protein
VAYLALGRLGPEFDLCEQLRLDPDAAMRDLFGVGLGPVDQRFQARLQLPCGSGVETVVDLAGIDQIAALAAADIEAIEFFLFQREALRKRAGL